MKRLLTPIVVLVAALALASPAAARTTVSHSSFQGIDRLFSRFLTADCGFQVTVRVDVRETDIEYANGEFAATIHFKATYITADGPQLIEDDNFRVFANAAETQFTYTGIPFRITDLDTGRVVIKDRGWVRFDDETGDFVAHGPHPSLVDGFDICAALS
jgi:hypothetical protein